MKLNKLRIQNFRGIQDMELFLDETTVLIGENNTGKTAILEVLRLCLRELAPRRGVVFDAFDFHLKNDAADPASADPIQITITFSEKTSGDWDDQLIGKLNRSKILQVSNDGRSHIILHINCAYDADSQDFKQNWEFHTIDNQPLAGISDNALSVLQHEVAYFYLSALRDAARHFDAKGTFWRPFLKNSQLSPEKKSEIELRLKEVNDLVVVSHTPFDKARTRLNTVQNIVPMASGEMVSIEAVPGRIFDMLAKAQIHLGTSTGAKVPVSRHGEGTQSLAVLMLFSAFLDAWPSSSPIIALEEPEAHLHPSAVRALWGVVENIPGQKIISTHSGDLLSEVPAHALRRLTKTSAGTKIFQINPQTLSPDEERKFNFHIRHARGELLFARCWLLVEGETEVTLLTEIARHLNICLEQAGVRCVSHRHAGVEMFLKVAKDLGIKWCVLADNDSQGASDQKHVKDYAGATPLANVLHIMPEKDIEGHLCSSGFGHIYEAYLSPQTLPRVTVGRGDVNYWPQVLSAIKKALVKPAAVLEVVNLIHKETVPIPPLLEKSIRSAVSLAGGL